MIQPPRNGSDAITTSRATPTLTGKPTANTFSCGTTLATIPKAMSVTTNASSTGAATSTAPTNTEPISCTAPATSGVSRGLRVIGIATNVAWRPFSIHASPPIARNTASPTSP